MAGGPSELQKMILRLALENRRDKSLRDKADILCVEVLFEYYHFVPLRGCSTHTELRVGPWRHFGATQIGEDRYIKASHAVYQAIRRLEKRGLVKRVAAVRSKQQHSGADLTAKGIKVAKRLAEES